jgi:hypothetical protein
VVQLRLTLRDPQLVFVLDRTDRGFDLALDLGADGSLRTLIVEGFDAAGALVATGMTPPLALTGRNSRVLVYMAPAMSVGPAPAALEPARSRSSAAALSYGAVLAGGVDSSGAPSDAISIYNAYDHSLLAGLAMPAPRAGVSVAVTSTNPSINGVFLFGGAGPDGAPTDTLWFFDTTAMPSGSYVQAPAADPDSPQRKRAHCAAVPLGGDRFLIAGAPPLQLATAGLTEPEKIPAFSSGATVTTSERVISSVLVGEATGEVLQLRGGATEPLGAQRPNATAAALPGGRIGVFGGEGTARDVLVVDAATGGLTPVPGALAETYAALAVAATSRFVVVAGVRPGGASTLVEILDAQTLERRHAVPVADELGAAIALPNGQVLLIGATLQLFTPPPPE